MSGVNDEREREPQGGEASRPQKRREGGLRSTPRPKPSWEKRGGWGNVTMISRGVEISIAGGGGEMVRAISLGVFIFFSFCNQIVIMFKGTKDSCSASYGDTKPISKRHPARFTSS